MALQQGLFIRKRRRTEERVSWIPQFRFALSKATHHPSLPAFHHVQTNNGQRFTTTRQSPLPAIQVMGLKDAHALLVVSFRAG
jgi:hypothetical protein